MSTALRLRLDDSQMSGEEVSRCLYCDEAGMAEAWSPSDSSNHALLQPSVR